MSPSPNELLVIRRKLAITKQNKTITKQKWICEIKTKWNIRKKKDNFIYVIKKITWKLKKYPFLNSKSNIFVQSFQVRIKRWSSLHFMKLISFITYIVILTLKLFCLFTGWCVIKTTHQAYSYQDGWGESCYVTDDQLLPLNVTIKNVNVHNQTL